MTLIPEMLADLRRHATHINEAGSIVGAGFVGQVTPGAFMQINPRMVLALLDRIEALERRVHVGARMANLCYNVAQRAATEQDVRESMTALHQEWDATL